MPDRTAPAATADDLRVVAEMTRDILPIEALTDETLELADRLETLASLLPTLLDVAETAISWDLACDGWHAGKLDAGQWLAAQSALTGAVAAYQEATDV
jgi:hypothetical protein